MCKSPLRTALLLTAPLLLATAAAWLWLGDDVRSAVFALLKLVVTR